MARSSTIGMVACFAILALLLVGAPFAVEGISCGQVTGSLAPCIAYLRGGGPVPPRCCAGVAALNNAAKTTPERQTACNCLKAAYNAIKGIQPGLAASLPGKCGVRIPYKISPSTDCTKVK